MRSWTDFPICFWYFQHRNKKTLLEKSRLKHFVQDCPNFKKLTEKKKRTVNHQNLLKPPMSVLCNIAGHTFELAILGVKKETFFKFFYNIWSKIEWSGKSQSCYSTFPPKTGLFLVLNNPIVSFMSHLKFPCLDWKFWQIHYLIIMSCENTNVSA